MTQEAYREMWENLNLDIEAHDGLLGVLGKFYGDIYMSQQGRLGGMEYLDFVLSEVHGLRIKELQEYNESIITGMAVCWQRFMLLPILFGGSW